ncbi:NAK/MPSK protein kinase [Phytophthora megakarya]|uniref:NAK/MPSK protein kinase n=1 Tax=Phytophthora megakarya TaxID=4795 RepID=A0A225X216_9STRA|nr:NAK/MPSK protein kinase [Phytophthora megakarya]
MAAKSRELVAHRTNGAYSHIGERLHDEALSDIAKKVQRHERRVVEREHQQNWMCPKCAHVNQYTDSRCQNVMALAEQRAKTHRGKSSSSGRRESASSINSSFGMAGLHPEIICGQPKPERLFQPTLLTNAANVMKTVSGNQGQSSRASSLRRQRHQNAVEKEFQQTCPFKPKISNVSKEIVREKHEAAAAAAAVHGETQRPRNPHHELYENSFQARALRDEREEEYFKQFPFKPDIGVNALWVSPDKSQNDFVERLAVDKYHELERKRVALYDKYAPDRDPQSGKELFKPEIGRAPAFARNKQGLPIGDFLHAAHREQQEYHRQLREKEQREIKKKSQQTFVSEASRQALERRKADTCKRIFNHLLRMRETLVHPVSGTTMAAPQHKSTFVLYALVGEELEPVQESKPQRGPDTSWNAFVMPLPAGRVRLADVQKAFPLGGSFHFAFRCEDGAYLDLTNPEAAVPFCGRKILARITPLDEEPTVEYLHYEEPRQAAPASIPAKLRTDSYGSSSERRRDDYEEFESTTYESQDEEPSAPVVRSPKARKEQGERDWNNYQNGYQDTEDGRFGREDRFDSIGSASRQSEWTGAGKDAQAYLRKQTEQAYDFAKKISIEDAKKGASETAKKAKKWGGSLLSSISATISNASTNVSKSETIQVGGVSVQVVRLLAEGAYAQVLLVRSATNETFALKRILCQSQEVENDVQMELQVFRSVKHLNIMPLVEFAEARVQQGMEFYFLVPYFERGSLWDAINAACQDIKPHNILLSSSSTGEDFLAYIPVVTDFGSCAPIRVEVNSRRNSLELQDEANRKSSAPYRAPELFEPTVDVALDGQSDVWSLGCVLYAMAFGTSPFEHPREGFMKLACLNGRVSFPPEQGGVVLHRGTQFTTEFCDFIRDMLHTNPEERPSVLDALEFTEELLNDEMQR